MRSQCAWCLCWMLIYSAATPCYRDVNRHCTGKITVHQVSHPRVDLKCTKLAASSLLASLMEHTLYRSTSQCNRVVRKVTEARRLSSAPATPSATSWGTQGVPGYCGPQVANAANRQRQQVWVADHAGATPREACAEGGRM